MIRKAAFLVIAVALAYSPARAQTYYSEEGIAVFRSSVPLHSFEGTSESLTGRIARADSTVDFYLDLATLETGIGKRDKDMRKTLDVDEHPFAEFFGHLLAAWDPENLEPQQIEAVGDFSIHGVTREVSVSGTITLDGSGIRLQAEWSLNLEDYAIEPPRLLIMKVDPVQQLSIDITLELEETQ